MTDALWVPPPPALHLAPEEVHVWRIPLVPSPHAALRRLLSPDEHARADRFVFDRHRHRFVAARGALRLLLARYLGTDPAALRFGYEAREKPFLVHPATPLRFNVSHSADLALAALAWDRRVGVDVEEVAPERATIDIARRFFAPEEVAVFERLPEAQWTEAFFNAWTRKEAYMKADGQGLSLGLGRFCVSLAPGEPAVLQSTAHDPEAVHRWHLRALGPGPGYAAALCAEGQDWQLRCFGWDGGRPGLSPGR